ncbi:MAG: hypothetical protein JXR07_01515 [Reichenbachiella sp.]
MFSNSVYAQSTLTELPFNIVIGETTNSEIENKGNCVQKAEGEDWCEIYDMAGNFLVYSSQSKVVNKVVFSAEKGNKLPRKWKELGLNFGLKNSPGTLDIDFNNIIKNNGAKYIESSRNFDEKGELQGILFSYEIDKLSFSVMIKTIKEGADILGLSEIVVTEAY